MAVRWRIELLGGLCVAAPEASIARFRTQKTGALLAYLAYHAGRTHPRELLTELFWPDDELEAARHKLSVALSWIRQQLEPQGVPDSSVVVADRQTLRLNPAAIRTDVFEFEQALRAAGAAADSGTRAQLLTGALELYKGPLLPGYYEEWVLPEQRRLEAVYFEAVRSLLPLLEQAEEYGAALQVALRAAALDPLREESQRWLIRLYDATAQPERALRQYEQLRTLLRKELGIEPSEETRRVVAGIRRELETRPWSGDAPAVLDEAARPEPAPEPSRREPPQEDHDPVGGAVPLDSPFYLVRERDAAAVRAVNQRTSILLIKGARQVGKTSLLARVLQHARRSGARTAFTDLQWFNGSQLASADQFLYAVARDIAEQLGSGVGLLELWSLEDGPNSNFRRFFRHLMQEEPERALVWALDDVDRLFTSDFGTDVFALMRAWHNERALDPTGPWSRLTLAIAYATEAHLFIADVNQSPFNVGTRLVLEDFTFQQVAHLNERYGAPLRDKAEIRSFWDLTSGHPYLTRRGLLELVSRKQRYAAMDALADDDDGFYGEHLRRVQSLLLRDRHLCQAVRLVLDGCGTPDDNTFFRLRSAGILRGDTVAEARPRCRLYSRYLHRHLPAQP